MAALPDFLKQNIKFMYGGVGLPFAAMDIKGLVDADNKFKAILKIMKDIVLAKVSLVGTFAAVSAAVRGLVKDTGSLDAALKRISQVQHFTRLFTPFIGGVKAARKEVADLINFAAHTPFKFEGVAQAAHTLTTLTRGRFAGEPALKKIGDAAAVSGNSIEESAKAVGDFYQALDNGEPIGRSVEALRQMGLISSTAANSLERLSESGATTVSLTNSLTSALEEARGGMAAFADDLESVGVAREKAVEGAKIAFAQPFTEREIEETKNYTEAIVAITPAIGKAADSLSKFVGGIELAVSAAVKWIAKSGAAGKAIEVFTASVMVLALALTAIGATALPAFTAFIARLMVLLTAATQSMGVLGTAARALGSILAGGLILTGWGAALAVVVTLGIALYQAANRANEFKKMLAEEAAAHQQAISTINSHIQAIQTLADKYQVVSEAIQQTIKDQIELNNLFAKREELRKTISEEAGTPQAIKAQQELVELEQRIEQQRKKIEADRKIRQRAERTSAVAGPEREALIQLQMRRQLALEEQRMEERISAMPGARPEILRQRAGVILGRAASGRRGVEQREQVALERDRLMAGRGEIVTAIASGEQQLELLRDQKGQEERRLRISQQLIRDRTTLDKIDADILKAGLRSSAESSVNLETRAQQLQAAIDAKAAQARGDTENARKQKLLAGGVEAGPEAGAQVIELQRRAAQARQFEAQSPELEAEGRRKMMEALEEERGRFVTELQTHIERGIADASRNGPPGQKELLTDLRSFISNFEELRRIFPDQKAAQLALEKVGTDLLNIPAEIFKPIGDSLTRIGGGGGVGGPTGDPRLIAAQRMNNLQESANAYLRQIESNTSAMESPESTALPPSGLESSPATSGRAALAQQFGLDVSNPNIDWMAVQQMSKNITANQAQAATLAQYQPGINAMEHQYISDKFSHGVFSPTQPGGDDRVAGILGNIFQQNKESNTYLGVVAGSAKDNMKAN